MNQADNGEWEVVKGSSGYYVIRVTERVTPSYEELRPVLHSQVLNEVNKKWSETKLPKLMISPDPNGDNGLVKEWTK